RSDRDWSSDVCSSDLAERMRTVVLAALLALGCGHKTTPVFPTCGDNKTNADETDVDCGGPLCSPCNTGKACLIDKDCRSMICSRSEERRVGNEGRSRW